MKPRVDKNDGRRFFEVRVAAEIGSWTMAITALSSLQADPRIKYTFNDMMNMNREKVYARAKSGIFEYGLYDSLKLAKKKWTDKEIIIFADHVQELFPDIDFDMTYEDYYNVVQSLPR